LFGNSASSIFKKINALIIGDKREKNYDYKTYATKIPNLCICANFQITEDEDLLPRVYHVQDYQAIRDLFESLNFQWKKGENHFLCMKMLYEIMSSIYTSQTGSYTSPQTRNRFSEAREYIVEHFTDPELSPSIVAEAVGISPVYLRKLFSRFAMMSPQEYIIYKRIGYAKALLKAEDISVSMIAELSGFADVGYFSKKFKSITGVPPIEYRTMDVEGTIVNPN